MDETYLTIAEGVAELLKLNQQTVRNTIDRGDLRAVRVGARRVRIKQPDLDAFSAAGSAMMGPSEEAARATFSQALEVVNAATANPELASALRRLATASTRLGAWVLMRKSDSASDE
jgi:excisionase family DNA binding protein